MPIPSVPSQITTVLLAKTYNAAWFSGGTIEAQIQSAITQAGADGALAVMVPANMLPFNGSLVTFNANIHMLCEGGSFDFSILNLDAYGVSHLGTADVTVQWQMVESLRPAGSTLQAVPGKTYLVGSSFVGGTATPAMLLRMTQSGTWDLTGATIKYNSSSTLTTGTDGGGYGVVNILTDNGVILNGTIDNNSKARYGLTYKSQIIGFEFRNVTIKNIGDEANSVWSSMAYACSVDITGTAISGRAKNIQGTLYRPSAPFVDAANVITIHANVFAFVVGGEFNQGNSTGTALVLSDTFDVLHHRMDTNGLRQFNKTGEGNSYLADSVQHDTGTNMVEVYGTSVANSATFGALNSDLLGVLFKFATLAGWGHANTGSDGTVPSLIIACRTISQAEIDFDYSATAGGRLVSKSTAPSEAVLVSGIESKNGNAIQVTLTAARLVGAPLNPKKGQRLTFMFTQGGAGAFAVTWNAVFKVTWSNAGNATGTRSAISFIYDGTNWNSDSAQAPYV